MDSRTRILLLFDNNGNEYVSRIQQAVSRACGSSGFAVQAENLFPSRKPIAELLDSNALAGVIVAPPLSDDRHVLGQIEERGLPYVRIAPMLDPDRGSTVVMDEYDAGLPSLLLQSGESAKG